MTYTIMVTNVGSLVATNVKVTDTLPASVTLVSATSARGTCSGTSTVVCSLNSIAPTNTATIRIVAQVNPAARDFISNNAQVSASQPDPYPWNNLALLTTAVQPQVDLHVSQAATPNPVIAGTTVTHTFIFTNRGPS